MAPRAEGSHLKRSRVSGSPTDAQESFKKPRRSERLSQRVDHDDVLKTPVQTKHHLPSPVTHLTSESTTEFDKEATATPPQDRSSQVARRRGDNHSQGLAFSSPPQDTQAFSQQDLDPDAPLVEGVDELKEGVWGYLLPLDTRFVRAPVVLKKKGVCPPPAGSPEAATAVGAKNGGRRGQKTPLKDQEQKGSSPAPGGYVIGRHPECDIRVDDGQVSNRHCLIFTENKGSHTVAVLEDLSTNGTYVNEAYLKRNDRRELQEGDEIAVTGVSPGFIFRYPRCRHGKPFAQEYTMTRKLGSGHFAQVFMCNEKSTGDCYAVKRFTKTPGVEEKSKYEGLHQEVAMLMSISHPNILCLKETFNDPEAVYVVLELAPDGELFHYISTHSKLTEAETRKVFVQLFEGIKYLHDRNMVHRDIKPENILLMDGDLTVKIGDFGLAKIVGEASFTTTLCGTPSYVAPEILVNNKARRYTKAVDIWSLGVVLYICLCGFPPFSDELRRADFPYELADQIRKGLFDYPSPYWDPVGDPALDLIDSMLVVDAEKRFTVDQCLAHPWLSQKTPGVNDSTNGLVSGIAGLEMSRRAPFRERTLLSSINTVHVTDRVPAGAGKPDVKVYSKNPKGAMAAPPTPKREVRPDDNRDPEEFMDMGGKGDQELFGNDGGSKYPTNDIAGEAPGLGGKQKGKAKAKGRGGR
ncbi:kinase-like domain-containing protein [Chaetomidium leptoderma]|uniref:Kinase-like domain-containing protein n=1 Tax=Chaetomidium leptoderma TaxID=669021 RepID=A0AAN6VUY0_9PEZI|nr:kinase-like domain-containing protein [Chaetomidium leptoderma]